MAIWIHPKHRPYVVVGAVALLLLLLYLLRDIALPLLGMFLAAWAFGRIAMVIAAGLLIWHAVRYLRDGFWNALSVLDVFRLTPRMAFHVDRALADWRGVERLMDGTPAWLALLIIGGISTLIFNRVDARMSAVASSGFVWLKSFLGFTGKP